MRKTTWIATCTAMAFGLATALVAQTPTPSQTSPSSGSAKTITVSGCIQRAAQAPTGTSGSASASRDSEVKFLLTSAAMSSSGATGTAGTAGTAGAAPSSTAVASEYRLDADDAKLTPHVGHKVEISGTVESSAGATQAPSASAANAPKLKVDAVKMVAATCP